MPRTFVGGLAACAAAALVALVSATAQAQGRVGCVADGTTLKRMTLDQLSGDATLAAPTTLPLASPTFAGDHDIAREATTLTVPDCTSALLAGGPIR